jgi:hypothetical protein
VKPRSNIGSDYEFGLRVNTHLPTLTEINQSLGPVDQDDACRLRLASVKIARP